MLSTVHFVGVNKQSAHTQAVGRAQTPAVMRVNQTILQVELVLMNHPVASCISCTTLWLLVSPGPLSLLFTTIQLSSLS